MHRAKGLEFDTVVLLGLAREPRPDEPKALQWLARATADGRDDLSWCRLRSRASRRRTARAISCGARNASATRPSARGCCTSRRRARASACTRLAAAGRSRRAAGELAARASVAGRRRDAARRRRAAARAASGRRRDRARAAPARRARGARAATSRRHGRAAPRAPGVRLGGPGRRARRHGRPSLLAAHRGAGARALDARSASPNRSATFARELELLGVEPAERASAADRVVAALVARARRPARPLGAGAARGSALGAAADAARRHRARARPARPDVRRGGRGAGSSTSRPSQHEGGSLSAFLDSEVERYAPQLERYAQAVAVDRSARRAARLVLSVARRASLVARGGYSEPVKLRRRRPSASGSAVMIFSPSTSASGAPARGSMSASSV